MLNSYLCNLEYVNVLSTKKEVLIDVCVIAFDAER